MLTPRYWLTPPELYGLKRDRWDPCPYPLPEGWDALKVDWKKPWYCNPPFSRAAEFTRKAIQEGDGYLIIPTTTPTQLLIEAGARLESLGRVAWLDCDTKKPMRISRAPPCLLAELP